MVIGNANILTVIKDNLSSCDIGQKIYLLTFLVLLIVRAFGRISLIAIRFNMLLGANHIGEEIREI